MKNIYNIKPIQGNTFRGVYEDEEKAQEIHNILTFYDAFKEFLEIFAKSELGEQVTINLEAVSNYMASGKFFIKYNFSNKTKNDIFQDLELEVLEGMPIWEMFNISSWLKDSLEKSFKNDTDKEIEELTKNYACYRCKFYNIIETPLGLLEKCNCSERVKKLFRFTRESFEIQTSCEWLEERSNRK